MKFEGRFEFLALEFILFYINKRIFAIPEIHIFL